MLNPKEVRAVNTQCLKCTRADCPGFCDELRRSLTSFGVKTIQWHGFVRTIPEWAEILGVSRSTLYSRLKDGDPEEVFESLHHDHSEKITGKLIEEVYLRISNMHCDYLVFWDRPNRISDSAGMVTDYDKVLTSPTHKKTSIVEQRAMPELMLADDANEKRAWISCVLYVIEQYRKEQNTKRGQRLKANILEWRAIDGHSLRSICDKINEELVRPITLNKVRSQMSSIVIDVANEALLRGLHSPQK